MRRLRVVVLVAIAAVLLSGCFRYQSSMVVDDDGSGRVQESLLVNRTVLESMFDTPAAVEAHLPRVADLSLPPWVTGRDHRNGLYQGVVFDLTFDDPGQLNERLNTLHRLIARATGSAATSTVDLVETDEGWSFTMQTTAIADVPEQARVIAAEADPSGSWASAARLSPIAASSRGESSSPDSISGTSAEAARSATTAAGLSSLIAAKYAPDCTVASVATTPIRPVRVARAAAVAPGRTTPSIGTVGCLRRSAWSASADAVLQATTIAFAPRATR